MMSKSIILLIALQASVAFCSTAVCKLGNQGEIVFTEKSGEDLSVRFHLHMLDHGTTYKIHIHQSAPSPSSSCDNLGGHFDPDGSDLGDLGSHASSADGHLHGETSARRLTVSPGDFSIMGRGVAIHGHNGAKEYCCTIE